MAKTVRGYSTSHFLLEETLLSLPIVFGHNCFLFLSVIANTSLKGFSEPCDREEVTHVRWNPKNENILASNCDAMRLVVWDLSRYFYTTVT